MSGLIHIFIKFARNLIVYIMKRTLFLLYTLCLFYITPTFSQDSQGYSFMHTNSETGLSQSNVKTVIQDSYGFIWFGTKNGLNRYDGQRVV